MKKRAIPILLALLFAIQALALLSFAAQDMTMPQDAIAVNEALQSVQADWKAMERHVNASDLSYVALDNQGSVRFRTGPSLSESVHAAVLHRDTILDIRVDGRVAGKLIVYNDAAKAIQSRKAAALTVLAVSAALQFLACICHALYLHRTLVRPFQKLEGFAERIAGGNLDTPLEMDRMNLFGAFTESFDIMRSELKKSRQAEAKANADKKELVAKLSHDIRTPVASIRAASEVGSALSDSQRIRDNYTQIIRKADQIDALVTDLFTATLEELQQLTVSPVDIASSELAALLQNADYLRRSSIPQIPPCLLRADRLRLQQVFDNIFANSYKYADTAIEITAVREGRMLTIAIEDSGGGVPARELPLLKEKFRRGSNAGKRDGAGLGLFISDYFLREMGGELLVENGAMGLRVSVRIAFSERI